jgi:hypothetical protein
MFLSETLRGNGLDLYDATTAPPTPINSITTTDGTYVNSINGDALWSNTDPNRIYYVPWAANATNGLQLRYVDVSKCTKSNCELKPVIVHSFSCKTDATSALGAGVSGNVIETARGGQGGMFDTSDRYFSFSCDNINGGGRNKIDLIRYDRTMDKVTTQVKWYSVCPGGEPKGCKTFRDCPKPGQCDVNIFVMAQHPDANYITIIWYCGDDSGLWTRGCGTEVYGPGYNFLGPASSENMHQDNGLDVNGVPVWVGVFSNRNDSQDGRAIVVTNLTTLSPTQITSKRILLPCSYVRAGVCDTGTYLASKVEASHISMTGSWGALPGYALFSTMTMAGAWSEVYKVDYPPATALGTEITNPGERTVTPASMGNIGVGVVSVIDANTRNAESVKWTSVGSNTATATFRKVHAASATVSCLSCGETGFGSMENLAVKIDTTAPDNSDAIFYRIGRAMSIRDSDYNAEPHTAVDRDFTQITWGSNWNTDGGRVYGFWTKLPAPAPKASDATTSPGAKPE